MKVYNKYQIALRVLINIKRKLNIVVVGANDGKTNDPIYNFAMERSKATSVLLVEPNKLLLPYLNDNYASHPSHRIANCAIGEEGTLTLYAIKQDVWDRFRPGYAKGWPSYRAATGLTSAIKSHLEKYLAGQNINPDGAIDTLNIPAKRLRTLLDELEWTVPIDVLQIDAEGYDDVVIYNSDLSYTRPKLICFESHNMSADKQALLRQYLSGKDYHIYSLGRDSLAVDARFHPTCVLLNLTMAAHSGLELISRIVRKTSAVMKSVKNVWE